MLSLTLGIEIGRQSRADEQRVGRILRRLRWRRRRVGGRDERSYRYFRPAVTQVSQMMSRDQTMLGHGKPRSINPVPLSVLSTP